MVVRDKLHIEDGYVLCARGGCLTNGEICQKGGGLESKSFSNGGRI